MDRSCAALWVRGGGTRIFGNGVGYRIASTSAHSMMKIKGLISHAAAERAQLKIEMEAWYQSNGSGRFPAYARLEQVSDQLSHLDTRYKRLWDAQQYHIRGGE